MTVKPIIFDNLLFGDLAPWKSHNTSENRFRDMLNNQLRANKDNPEQFFKALMNVFKEYSIENKLEELPNNDSIANLAKYAEVQTDFSMLKIPIFFNKASEFYYYLINNECIRIRAAIATKVLNAKSNVDSEFQVVTLLNNLAFTIEQIAQKTYSDKVSTYVLNALKLSLFRLYEEIKLTFPDSIGNEALSEYEIINFIAPDFETKKNIPDTLANILLQYLNAKEKAIPIPVQVEKHQNDIPTFIPNKSDFRTGYKGKLSYEDVRNNQLFSDFESKLYDYEYIGLDYNFTNKHKKKKELATIFKILTSKNYFKEKNIKHHNKFKDFEYRQYLDNRYNVDTSQQFKKCNSEDIDALIKKYYWLENLPICR